MKTIADFIAENRAEWDASPLAHLVTDFSAIAPIPCVSPTGDVIEMIPPLPPLATPTDDRSTLVASPVVTDEDALVMGRIRDARREGFSQDQSSIDEARQLDWWRRMRLRVNGYLYFSGKHLVGYGCLIQEPSGRWVSSCAVLRGCEGRSFGKRILSHLINSVGHEVYAQALVSNPAAVALHNPLEWEQTGVDDTLVYFRTRPKVRVEHSLNAGDYAPLPEEPTLPCGWWMGTKE
jgi:hypothetical protein